MCNFQVVLEISGNIFRHILDSWNFNHFVLMFNWIEADFFGKNFVCMTLKLFKTQFVGHEHLGVVEVLELQQRNFLANILANIFRK
jgi:hypothetical protein